MQSLALFTLNIKAQCFSETWLRTNNYIAQNPTRPFLQRGRYENHKFRITDLTILLLLFDIQALNMKTPHPFATSLIYIHCSGNRPRTPLLDIYHPDPWHAPVAASTVVGTPDDGGRKSPKHVQ